MACPGNRAAAAICHLHRAGARLRPLLALGQAALHRHQPTCGTPTLIGKCKVRYNGTNWTLVAK